MTDTPTTTPAPEIEEGRAQALSYAAELAEKLAALRAANEADDYGRADELADELYQLPVEVSWRAVAWQTTTQAPDADEFRIMLSWGGPSVQITGELDMDGEVCSHRLEWQDWFKPWTEVVPAHPAHAEAVGEFARLIWEARG